MDTRQAFLGLEKHKQNLLRTEVKLESDFFRGMNIGSHEDMIYSPYGIPIEMLYLVYWVISDLVEKPKQVAVIKSVIEAIPVGAKLRDVQPKFLLWFLSNDPHGVIHSLKDILARPQSPERTAAARMNRVLTGVVAAYERSVSGKQVPKKEWGRLFVWANKAGHAARRYPNIPEPLIEIASTTATVDYWLACLVKKYGRGGVPSGFDNSDEADAEATYSAGSTLVTSWGNYLQEQKKWPEYALWRKAAVAKLIECIATASLKKAVA